jgi:hypothetical protein
MQWPRCRRGETTVALVLSLALAAGCGSGGGSKIAVQPSDGQVAVDGPDSSSDGPSDAVVVVVGHCCTLQATDASAAGCGGSGDASLGFIEPCLTVNSGGTYGRWTCGAGGEPPVCGNNGLSCAVGDPCTLVDIGCPGVVQLCDFKPYTPPPG